MAQATVPAYLTGNSIFELEVVAQGKSVQNVDMDCQPILNIDKKSPPYALLTLSLNPAGKK
jgi:hypothetical protein